MNFRNQFEKKENDGVKAVLAKIIKQFNDLSLDQINEEIKESLIYVNDKIKIINNNG